MAKINYEYCEDKVLYDSGEVEEWLLNEYKKGNTPSEKKVEYFYSVTPVRENIVNWYPFKKNSRILEIGGGLGAVTGCLCDKSSKVVSVEYSKRRAETIYYRHKNRDNLEVIVGNFEKINFEEKFDYIVLIGVFEYAKRFFNTKDPFNEFLIKMKKLLKTNGVILIAIENRYGIKYFAGSNEDHYGEKYLGLKGYENHDIQTFGKKELSDIVKKAGFKYEKYYYPYPDYKMPYIIYTDERVPYKTEINSLLFYNHDQKIFDFNYKEVLAGIIQNEQFGFFANSFLLEITNDKKELSEVKYAKTSYNRNDKYQIYTMLLNDGYYKTPKYKESIEHLDNLIRINEKIKSLGFDCYKIEKQNNWYKTNKVNGMPLTEYIEMLVQNNDKNEILKEIDIYYNLLKKMSTKKAIKKYVSDDEKKLFGNKKIEILKIGLLDMHMSNIIKNNNKYTIIDQEWESKYDIPTKQMLYFALCYLYELIKGFDKMITLDDILKRYDISPEEIKIYKQISDYAFNNELKANNKVRMEKIDNQNIIQISADYYNEIINIKENQRINLINDFRAIQEQNEKLYGYIEEFKKQNLKSEKNIIDLKEELVYQKEQIDQKNKENKDLISLNNSILNSKRWIFINKMMKIYDKLKFRK